MGPSIRVVLVPSTRDAHADAVHPQPPLPEPTDWEVEPGQVVCAPSPCLLRLGGAVVGATSHDVLKHLAAAEASREPEGGRSDRMARLAAHLVAQGSFYPLSPAAPGACVDSSLAAAGLAMSVRPDLLILPSDLAPFAKLVSTAVVQPRAAEEAPVAAALPAGASGGEAWGEAGVEFVAINPGRAAKGALGGSFAHIHVAPLSAALPPGAEKDEAVPMETEAAQALAEGATAAAAAAPTAAEADVPRRTRVDLVRV